MSESISNNFLVLQYENNHKKRSIKETQDLVFCYFMGRLANYIIYNEINDISEFDLSLCHSLDFFMYIKL